MNNQPTKEEINIKLAEFMGNKIAIPSNLHELSERQLTIYLPFSHSLDALVPVWQKLVNKSERKGIMWDLSNSLDYPIMYPSDLTTPQEAAALATYYAVMEDEKNG
jgi:hypothetical protein